MRTHVRKTAQLGDLVVAAFDQATLYTTDPEEASRLATTAVMHFLRRRRRHSYANAVPHEEMEQS